MNTNSSVYRNHGGAVVRAPGAALAARLFCGARSLGIERSWWRREWRERELITLVTGYNVSMFAALCRGGRLSVRGAVSVGLCARTIVLLRQPKTFFRGQTSTLLTSAGRAATGSPFAAASAARRAARAASSAASLAAAPLDCDRRRSSSWYVESKHK